MTDTDALAIAALWSSIHNLRILVNRGLVRPEEVDDFEGAVLEGLQQGTPEVSSVWEAQLVELFADLKRVAEATWIGRDGSPSSR